MLEQDKRTIERVSAMRLQGNLAGKITAEGVRLSL
jgi:hypothetical protein